MHPIPLEGRFWIGYDEKVNWKALFDRLGLDGTRWQWHLLRWQKAWADRRAGLTRRKEQVTYQHKMCPACGALVDRNDSRCAQCGAPVGRWRAQVMRRTLGLVLPGGCPVASLILIAIFGHLLVVMVLFGASHLLKPDILALVRSGALVPALVYDGQIWRVITYGYVHGGLLHILFNGLALSQVGITLEKEIGGARLFAVYTLTLIGGAAADLIVRGAVYVPIVGASGALFGLIGFGLAYGHFLGGPAGRTMRNFYIHWAIYGFLFGYMVRADNIAHLGGFLPGLVLGFLVERERSDRHRFTGLWNGLAWLSLAATVASFVMLAWWARR